MTHFEFLKRLMLYCTYHKMTYKIDMWLDDEDSDLKPICWKAKAEYFNGTLNDVISSIEASKLTSILFSINSVTDDIKSEYNILIANSELAELMSRNEEVKSTIEAIIYHLAVEILRSINNDEVSILDGAVFKIATIGDYYDTQLSDMHNKTLGELERIYK